MVFEGTSTFTGCNSNSATESSFTLLHYASINLFVYNWE